MPNANTKEVAVVKGNLPNDCAEQFGWTDEKIATVLDAVNLSVPQTVRQFWLERLTNTHEYMDINESGSGRTLSQVHVNAKEMLAYWDKRVAAEGIVTLKRPISFGSIDKA